jgi:hypothetical protein
MEVEIAKPALVEPGIKYFLNETLSNCAKFKKKYYNDMLNIGIASFLILSVILFLYYKYKGKPTPMQKMLKERDRKHYILSRIKNYQDAKKLESQTNITGLPAWENEYDNV